MSASLTMLTGGSFQDANGNVLAFGYLTLKLSQDGNVAGVGNICSGVTITIQLDVNGNVASLTSPTPVANQYVWANSNIAPINTYYKVTGYTQEGQRAFGPNNQQVGSGTTFNLGSWVPNSVLSWFPNPQSLALEVNSVAASSQTVQNLEAGSGITITDNGSGNIEFASTSALNVEVGGTPITSTNPINFEGSGGVVVNNPSAGNVQISGGGGGALGKWPGNWFGCTVPISGSALFTAGAQFGVDFVISTETSVDATTDPTATQPRSMPLINDNATDSAGVNDQNTITLGILQDWITKCMLESTLTSRFWIGLSDVAVNPTTALVTNTPNQNIVAFRWTAGTDTNIQAICATSSAALTVVDTGVLPTPSTPQIFEIVPSSGAIKFYINGILVASINTNVPSTSTPMRSIMLGDTSNISNVWQLNFYYFWEFLSV